MEINFNVTGPARKKLVQALGEILECDPKYLGPPTFAYEVDYFTIGKEGSLSFDDRADSEEIEHLIESLHDRGFEAQEAESPTAESVVIEFPLDGVTDTALENLRLLVASKEDLLKQALDVQTLTVETVEDRIRFPWFDRLLPPEELNAYATLLGKMLAMAKTNKRVNAKQKDTDNPKFTFRCFLLRLGYVGDEFKADRKLLMSRLGGNSAFKDGAPKKEEVNSCTE